MSRCRLINDSYLLSFLVICISEQATLHERGANRTKVIGTDCARINLRRKLSFPGRMTLNLNTHIVWTTSDRGCVQRIRRRYRGALNARLLLRLAYYPAKEIRQLSVRCQSRPVSRHSEHQNFFRIESGIDLLQFHKAAQQQTCGD